MCQFIALNEFRNVITLDDVQEFLPYVLNFEKLREIFKYLKVVIKLNAFLRVFLLVLWQS